MSMKCMEGRVHVKRQGTKKRKWAKTHVWMPAVALLFAWSAVTVGLFAGDTPQAAIPSLLIAAVLFFLWRRRYAAADRVLLAGTAEKKLARLQKVSGDEALYKIAAQSDEPVRGETLRRISDRGIFLRKALELDAFALEQITEPEQLYAVAAAEDFFPERKKKTPEVRARCLAFRKQAADRIRDGELLARLARAGDEPGVFAAEKLLREYPEEAPGIWADESMPENVRAMAKKAFIGKVKRDSAADPEAAAAFCRDRTLPLEARLAALGEIDGQPALLALYDPEDQGRFREALICRITEENALAEIIEKEPLQSLRLAAEKRVKDPERRREYCRRDGAHDFVYVESSHDSTEGTSHIYYDEYDIYRCKYCGCTTKEYTRSWHD